MGGTQPGKAPRLILRLPEDADPHRLSKTPEPRATEKEWVQQDPGAHRFASDAPTPMAPGPCATPQPDGRRVVHVVLSPRVCWDVFRREPKARGKGRRLPRTRAGLGGRERQPGHRPCTELLPGGDLGLHGCLQESQ